MRGYTLTLTSANTNYRIATLIESINSTEATNVSSLTILADSANAADILVGDAALATTRYGVKLAPGESVSFDSGSGTNNEATSNKYVRSSSALQVVHVTLIIT